MRGSGLGVAVLVGLGLGVAAGGASAATVTLAASKDNTMVETPVGAGELSNGLGPIFAGRTNQVAGSSLRRGLIAFDLSSIPAGASVSSVSLTLSAVQTRAGAATDMSLFRVTRDWGEGTSSASGTGAPATTGDATWYHSAFPGTSWTTPGGDFVSTPSATISILGTGNKTWSAAQMAADVQGWLNNPATNFGWVLVGNETTNLTAYEFTSGESTTGGGPALTVTYEAVPEPAGLGVLAVAAGWLAGRNRRRA